MGEDDALLVEEAILVVLIAQALVAIAATDTDEGTESQARGRCLAEGARRPPADRGEAGPSFRSMPTTWKTLPRYRPAARDYRQTVAPHCASKKRQETRGQSRG
jgi:hypothetical protein